VRTRLTHKDGWDTCTVRRDGVFEGALRLSEDRECRPDTEDVSDREQGEDDASDSHASGLRASPLKVAMG
jgi:hypothetical protein